MQVDANFFAQYDALGAESTSLSSAESNLRQATAARDKCAQDLNLARKALADNEKYAQEQRERIQRVSTHWFYGSTALQPQLPCPAIPPPTPAPRRRATRRWLRRSAARPLPRLPPYRLLPPHWPMDTATCGGGCSLRSRFSTW